MTAYRSVKGLLQIIWVTRGVRFSKTKRKREDHKTPKQRLAQKVGEKEEVNWAAAGAKNVLRDEGGRGAREEQYGIQK